MSMSHRYDILHTSKDWKLMAIQDVLEKDHVLGCHGFPLDWLADSCLHLWQVIRSSLCTRIIDHVQVVFLPTYTEISVEQIDGFGLYVAMKVLSEDPHTYLKQGPCIPSSPRRCLPFCWVHVGYHGSPMGGYHRCDVCRPWNDRFIDCKGYEPVHRLAHRAKSTNQY